MEFKKLLKQEFQSNGLPVNKGDIKYIQQMFTTVIEAQAALKNFPELKNEVPITIFDKGELLRD